MIYKDALGPEGYHREYLWKLNVDGEYKNLLNVHQVQHLSVVSHDLNGVGATLPQLTTCWLCGRLDQ
ncbi:hypothetical protein BST61_g11093 [Cercospora zeina]